MAMAKGRARNIHQSHDNTSRHFSTTSTMSAKLDMTNNHKNMSLNILSINGLVSFGYARVFYDDVVAGDRG